MISATSASLSLTSISVAYFDFTECCGVVAVVAAVAEAFLAASVSEIICANLESPALCLALAPSPKEACTAPDKAYKSSVVKFFGPSVTSFCKVGTALAKPAAIKALEILFHNLGDLAKAFPILANLAVLPITGRAPSKSIPALTAVLPQ